MREKSKQLLAVVAAKNHQFRKGFSAVTAFLNLSAVFVLSFLVYVNYWGPHYMPNLAYHFYYPSTISAAITVDTAYRFYVEKRIEKIIPRGFLVLLCFVLLSFLTTIWFLAAFNTGAYPISVAFGGTVGFGSDPNNPVLQRSSGGTTGSEVYEGVYAMVIILLVLGLWNLFFLMVMATHKTPNLTSGSRVDYMKASADKGEGWKPNYKVIEYVGWRLQHFQGKGWHLGRQKYNVGWPETSGPWPVLASQIAGFLILTTALAQSVLGLYAATNAQQLWIPVQAPWMLAVFFSWWLVNPPIPYVHKNAKKGVKVSFHEDVDSVEPQGGTVEQTGPNLEPWDPNNSRWFQDFTSAAKEIKDKEGDLKLHSRVKLILTRNYLRVFYHDEDPLDDVIKAGDLYIKYALGTIPPCQWVVFIGLLAGLFIPLGTRISWFVRRENAGIGWICGDYSAQIDRGWGIEWPGGFNETYIFPSGTTDLVKDGFNQIQCGEDILFFIQTAAVLLGVVFVACLLAWSTTKLGTTKKALRASLRDIDLYQHNHELLKKYGADMNKREFQIFKKVYTVGDAWKEVKKEEVKGQLVGE